MELRETMWLSVVSKSSCLGCSRLPCSPCSDSRSGDSEKDTFQLWVAKDEFQLGHV